MEREISRQIEEDLARGKYSSLLFSKRASHPLSHYHITDPSTGLEESRAAQQKNDGILKRVASLATGAADAVRSTFSPSKPRVKYPSAWDLPPVSDAELKKSFGSSSVKD